METEIKPHCWHNTWLPGSGMVIKYEAEVCCNCGITWSEDDRRFPRAGHGAFDPEPGMIPKPTGNCKIKPEGTK